ncbi:hypothetical protein AHF37_10133 [Paragonimus kellicotti]|nr:hypothetical protein AHF37_10133 [Paragonimus kellicotti]
MQQRASFQSRVNHLTSLCWEKCVSGYPPGKLDGKKSTCLENCAERYLDVSILLRTRFQAMLSKLQHSPVPICLPLGNITLVTSKECTVQIVTIIISSTFLNFYLDFCYLVFCGEFEI